MTSSIDKLKQKLNNRTDGSIEYKHQNISAILLESNFPYIIGYKPAYNYQQLLKDVVVSFLGKNEALISSTSDQLINVGQDINVQIDWEKVLDNPPVINRNLNKDVIREFVPRQYNFAEREQHNRKLGIMGEEFVLNYERHRLIDMGHEDLAKEVEWTSKKRGDGAGYDIRSFLPEKDQELFIEVKTTNSGKYQPFLITDNEVAFSIDRASQYSLYRVFQFKSEPKLYTLDGNLIEHVNLKPKLYRASF